MKLYTYKAMDKSGSIVSDTIKAGGISEVEIEIEKRPAKSIFGIAETQSTKVEVKKCLKSRDSVLHTRKL